MPAGYPTHFYPSTPSTSTVPYFGNFEHLQHIAAVYGNNYFGGDNTNFNSNSETTSKYQNL